MVSAKISSIAFLLTPFLLTANLNPAQAESPTPGESATEASLLSENIAQGRPEGRVRRNPMSPNYLGIGVNIGFDGNTALGETEFAVNGRIKITPNLSFRPSAVIGDNAAILVPVTYDFVTPSSGFFESFPVTPYVGGGVFFTTDDESEEDLGALVTAGLDLPLSEQFTANAGLNVGFVNDDTEWGLLLGVGYNIPRN